MYKSVLIPVDGSDVSNHAVDEGLKLASQLGSRVTVLHVIDIALFTIPDAESGVTNFEVIQQGLTNQGKRLLEEIGARAKAAGVEAETVMAEGDVHDEITKAAVDKKADLIIMGTHGRRGINRLILGSVAESVARRAHCAVLLIRPE